MLLFIDVVSKGRHGTASSQYIAPITGLLGFIELLLQIMRRGCSKAVARKVANDLAGQHRVPPLAEWPNASGDQIGGFKQQIVANKLSLGVANQLGQPINCWLTNHRDINDQSRLAVGSG